MARPATERRAVDDVLDELSRELHDQVAQTLNLLLVEMERFKLEQAGRAEVQREMDFMQAATREALANLRRVLFDLRTEPSPFEDLRGALEELRQRVAGIGMAEVHVSVDAEWPEAIPGDTGLNILRVVQEAAINALRHSRCRRLRIEMTVLPEYLVASVSDDGTGLDESLLEVPSLGLRSMRERAALAGGDLIIASEPDRGTTVTLTVPQPRWT